MTNKYELKGVGIISLAENYSHSDKTNFYDSCLTMAQSSTHNRIEFNINRNSERCSILELIMARNDACGGKEGFPYESQGLLTRNPIMTQGVLMKEGSLFVPQEKIKRYWIRDSILNNSLNNYELAKFAVDAHKNNKEFFPNDLIKDFNVELYLKNLVEGKDYLPLENIEPIVVKDFCKDPRSRWALQNNEDALRIHKKILMHVGIKTIQIDMASDMYIDSQEKPFVNQIYLSGFGRNINIDGASKNLDNNYILSGSILHLSKKDEINIKEERESQEAHSQSFRRSYCSPFGK